jgi:hypothetical protein
MVDSGSNISGDLANGFYFTHLFQTFFPFPSSGYIHSFTTFIPVSPVDAFTYTVFVYQGIWVAWMLLAAVYIVIPVPLRVYRTSYKSKSPAIEIKQEKYDRRSILTGMLVLPSLLFSIITFSMEFNLWNYGYTPFLIVAALSAVLFRVFVWREGSSVTAPMTQRIGVLQCVRRLLYQHRDSIARRIAILLFLFYLIAVVDAGQYIRGDISTGFYYSGSGLALFPFPRIPYVFAEVILLLPSIQVFVYIVFVYRGIWIAWASLSLLYIAIPLVSWAYKRVKKTTLLHDQGGKERIEGISIITGSAAFLSILFSVGTYSVTSNFRFFEPIMFAFVLVLSVLLTGILLQSLGIISKLPS